jgi:hypothetical protein
MNKRTLEKIARLEKYRANEDEYNKMMAIVVGVAPVLAEFLEDLNEVLPEFFSKAPAKALNDMVNKMYYMKSEVSRGELADEHNAITEWFRKNCKALEFFKAYSE